MIIEHEDICALCEYDNRAPDGEPCVRCSEDNLKFKWGTFPVYFEKEIQNERHTGNTC